MNKINRLYLSHLIKRHVSGRNGKILALVSIIAGLLLTGCTRTQLQGGRAETRPPESGGNSASIVFEASDMEGNVVSEDIFSQSKLTMVNVWATYCNPCLREMPDLGALAEEYADEDFQIVGIISDVMAGADQKSLDLAANLIEQTGAGYTHLLLNESLYYGLLRDVTAVPTTFFIDENGAVLDVVVGSMKKSAWEEQINALLENQ
ncbi:MAG: TlpA family protein disulfide reductase [bacterium]|nr:TlpA family protein disulfide reductase [bacterium]MCM1376623.1 TlpA family protein disulfide reductase [Muribaculum sp.]